MRKFGLLGGTSWHSTIDYYRALNEKINTHFGGNVNPPLYIANLNQAEIHRLQQHDDWAGIGDILVNKCRELELIGCEGLAFCANTPHRVFDAVLSAVDTPILHIGDAIGKAVQARAHERVALLGTRYTMEGSFIIDILREKFSIDILTPREEDRIRIQKMLYDEMSHGRFLSQTREYFVSMIDGLKARGAQAVILGCTEFPILLNDINVGMPKIDSTACHVNEISKFILTDDA